MVLLNLKRLVSPLNEYTTSLVLINTYFNKSMRIIIVFGNIVINQPSPITPDGNKL